MLKVPQTAGDVFDRITILLLKISNSDRRIEALEELVKLSAALAKQIEQDEWEVIAMGINELFDTNESLWDLENDIRALDPEDTARLPLISEIHRLNAVRHDSKCSINDSMVSDVYEVKDYTITEE